MSRRDIINVGIIAHVDAGKSTLVDALLDQTGVFRDNEERVDCVMDANDLEKERGITIYSKNCSIEHEGVRINVVDTPGHADFSSEVERIMKTLDTAILLVDSSEGPMPQTRFVLSKALEHGLKPILLINKMDKSDQRAEEVVNMVFDLFIKLDATDEQCDFPILYGSAVNGIIRDEWSDDNEDILPLIQCIKNQVDVYPNLDHEPLQLQASTLDYDEYVGRLGIGRILKGVLELGQSVEIFKRSGETVKGKISKMFTYEGINRVESKKAYSGDIVVFAGIPDIQIGETLGAVGKVDPMEMIEIEKPTLSMNFYPNKSPFAGRSGKFLTNRKIKERLDRELESNVGLLVEPLVNNEGFKVSGRGELHLSILLENMRREGYELGVSKPEVLFREKKGKVIEPYEEVIIQVPDEFAGTVISKLNMRKGQMVSMHSVEELTTLEYLVPTRGLLGYRMEFINSTRGEGTMERSFDSYGPHVGEIPGRLNGVMVSMVSGQSMAYSLFKLKERGEIFIEPALDIYKGQIIGLSARDADLYVNPTKNKKLTNVRSSGADEALKLIEPRDFTLEEALEFIEDDELVEITPDSIRLRKKEL
ncbi:MAG TPA: translational GTPase TypA [Clostridia bacterium]|nr:translational GTPase TypA [Clostridia bacterium]